jgi:cyclopropane-fatty-acyl-phospholipid synthase
VHAASTFGCQVTTTTISDAQYTYATKRVAEAGLAGQVTVLDQDYRDLDGTYDKLVSIEMIEAVGWQQLDTFFSACSDLLRDDGLMALQTIVVADQSYERAKRHQDFIKRLIFPGGCLHSVEAVARSTARATDLRMVDLEDIGCHYAETLRRWRANLRAHGPEAAALDLGERFQRLWDFYLCYCEAAFAERHVSDVQIVLAKPAWRGALLTRPA